VLVQRLPICDWYAAQVEHDAAVDHPREAIGCEMIRPLLGNDDEVCVRNTVSMDQVAHPLKRENLSHATTDPLGTRHDAGCYRIGDVREMIDVLVGNDETLAWSSGLECHERRDDVVTIDETCGLSSGDYLAENTAHRRTVLRDIVLTRVRETF
jgi:hypothetical protein